MSKDYSANRKFNSWTFMKNDRMYDAINMYGHKISQLGIFEFMVDATGTITGTVPTKLLYRINKWPHIKWYLTVRNDGTNSIFLAILNNTGGAQDKFMTEITRILDLYPWCAGLDVDLERGGGVENKVKAAALFFRISNIVHTRVTNNLLHVALPPMTGVDTSIGGETWCDYASMNAVADAVSIMSYGYAWAGSAPGPMSPISWVNDVFDYAVQVIAPEKIFLGIPAYGFRWQIDHTPAPGGYRGSTGLTYYGALGWVNGDYNHTGDLPPQPMIPFAAMWDDEDKVPYIYVHVYDYLQGAEGTLVSPMAQDSYGKKNFVTAYSKEIKKTSTGIVATINAPQYNSISGAYTETATRISPRLPEGIETPMEAIYTFSVPSTGTYDIAIHANFPWFNQNSLDISLDGVITTLDETRQWYPFYRFDHWVVWKSGVNLSAGNHSIIVTGGGQSANGTQFWGFEVAESIVCTPSGGEASFTMLPKQLMGKNGVLTEPATNWKVTLETLRRDPDSALIWYEDFKDYGVTGILPSQYYKINSGTWFVYNDPEDLRPRPFSWVIGSGEFQLDYSFFSEVHVRARVGFTAGSAGRSGLYFGNLFLCLNMNAQALELYENEVLKGSYAMVIQSDEVRQFEMRVRGTTCKVYSGYGSDLRFTAIVGSQLGSVGIRSDVACRVEQLRLGDAWYYEPYERVKVQLPGGITEDFGRVDRTNVTWDDTYQIFRVNTDAEEPSTRTVTIPMEYDYFHSRELDLITGQEYPIKILSEDKNVWNTMLFLGDKDGFSIIYYNDADTIQALAYKAAYDWRVNGIALWSLGQEDMAVWKILPQVITSPDIMPQGFPRQIADGLVEDNIHFKYKFDGSDPTLVLTGAQISTTDGRFRGKSLDCLTGSATLPKIPLQGAWGPRTIHIWVKPTAFDVAATATWKIVATQRTSGDRGYSFALYNGGLIVRAYDSTGTKVLENPSAPCPLVADKWQLVTFAHGVDPDGTGTQRATYDVIIDSALKYAGTMLFNNTSIAYGVNTWQLGNMGTLYPYKGKIGGMFIDETRWTALQTGNYFGNVDKVAAL
jgi:spore germination protein YaaH